MLTDLAGRLFISHVIRSSSFRCCAARLIMPKQTSLFSFFSAKQDTPDSQTTVLKEKPTTQNTKTVTPTNKVAAKIKSPKTPLTHSSSSSKTPASKSSSSSTSQSKSSQKRKSSVKETTKQVNAIKLDDEDDDAGDGSMVDENGNKSDEDSPVKQRKRRRVQIVESDEEEEEERMEVVSAKYETPKQAKSKPSKERKSRISNRKATPYVSKTSLPDSESNTDEEEESSAEPTKLSELPKSPVKSRDLSRFEYKKRVKRKERHNVSPVKFKAADNSEPSKIETVSKTNSSSPKNIDSSKNEKVDVKKDSGGGDSKVPNEQSSKTSSSSSPSVDPTKYDPSKDSYSPNSDACWKAGESVPYAAVAATLQAIEKESKRLKITEILSNFLRSVCLLSPDNLHTCVYLCTNQVAPAYEGVELGIGENVVMKAIGEACGINLPKLKSKLSELGDLGILAENSRSKQKMMINPKPLTVDTVFKTFYEIANMSGNQSQNHKMGLIKRLLVSCQGCEARYITRSLLGKLRIGLAEQTVLVSLGHATLLTPPGGKSELALTKNLDPAKADAALAVKTCFCEYPNYEHVIKMIRQHGVMEAPKYCGLSPGVPVKPMLAHPTKGISEVLQRFSGCEFTCEFKYDGERAQIQYKDGGEMSIFSRNQENNTSKYPDVISRMGTCMGEGTTSFILDCEVVAWDLDQKKILPFQILTTRKRKDADKDEIKVKVCLFAFDLLYLNGESLVKKPFRERRSLLHSSFKEVEGEFLFATAKDCKDTEEIQEFLEESIKGQCEGLMVKTLDRDATYEIAKRSHNWLKVKKDYLEGVADSLDLVVIGAYYGKGKRSGLYGGYLLACYDPDSEEYQAICKIGTGFTDEDLAAHHKTTGEHIITEAKSYYSYPDTIQPDVWFEPSVLWEVKCADLSISPIYTAAVGIVDSEKGISLRFPRFIRIRDDKTPEDATSAQQVAELYRKQDNKQAGTFSEDFY